MTRLADKVVIVTGAAQGIGAAYALALAAAGASICASDILDPAPTVERIIASGGKAVGVKADVSDAASVAALVRTTIDTFGHLDVLVNNAAIFASLERTRLEDITSSDWDRLMAVNVRGSFECVKAVLPTMRERGSGKIINIASTTVFTGQPGLLHYVTSKGAILAMTRALAKELGDDNITVNCIAPGLTMSEGVRKSYGPARTQPAVASRALKREQLPEDLIGTLLFLASSESDFMTGQVLVVDGGGALH